MPTEVPAPPPQSTVTTRGRRAVQLSCAALFLGTTFCSLWLSASSTLNKAELVHVPAGAVWSAVGVLELVSLAGTMRWLIARNRRGRVHAIAVVAAVAVVTGFAGWAAYGWFGLVAPIAVVATIHMVHETLDDLTPGERQWGGPAEVDTPPVQPSTAPELEAPTKPAVEPAPEQHEVEQAAPALRLMRPVDNPALPAPTEPESVDDPAPTDPLRIPGASRTWRQARPIARELDIKRRADWGVDEINAAIDEALREVSA